MKARYRRNNSQEYFTRPDAVTLISYTNLNHIHHQQAKQRGQCRNVGNTETTKMKTRILFEPNTQETQAQKTTTPNREVEQKGIVNANRPAIKRKLSIKEKMKKKINFPSSIKL